MAPAVHDVVAGLRRFVAQYEAISAPSRIEGLVAFLAAIRPLLSRPMQQPSALIADPSGFADAIRAITGPLGAARDAGVLTDPWALAGLKRREVANAAVLAGLWSPASGGLTAIEFLAAFFNRLRLRPGGHALPDRVALTSNYQVRTEDRPMGEGADRVDITIEGQKFLIGIEVKIDAGLQPDQLKRYLETIRRRAKSREKQATVIFLSRRRANHPDIVQASWRDIEVAGRAVAEQKGPAQAVNHHLIKCFVARAALFAGERN